MADPVTGPADTVVTARSRRPAMAKFYVEGGIFKDLADPKPMPGTEESYGPFESEREADKVWRARMAEKIDICNHRLRVFERD
jgi:hypothetical protein